MSDPDATAQAGPASIQDMVDFMLECSDALRQEAGGNIVGQSGPLSSATRAVTELDAAGRIDWDGLPEQIAAWYQEPVPGRGENHPKNWSERLQGTSAWREAYRRYYDHQTRENLRELLVAVLMGSYHTFWRQRAAAQAPASTS